MDAQLNPIEQACAAVGNARALARRLRVSPPTISQWARAFDDATGALRDLSTLKADSDWRPVPKERCPAIELAVAGKVAVESLRPDQRWVRVPDRDWPHPSGRPCIDVMGPASGLQAAVASTCDEVSHAA